MMKLFKLTILCVFVLNTSPLFAETETVEEDVNWTLQVDPLTTYLGYVHLQLERKLSSNFSVYAGPHARLFSAPGLTVEDHRGVGVELGVRYYPWGEALRGPWALVRGVGAYIYDDNNEDFGGYISALVGYTYILNNFWVFSGGAGVQYIKYQAGDVGPNSIFPALHTAIGIAF